MVDFDTQANVTGNKDDIYDAMQSELSRLEAEQRDVSTKLSHSRGQIEQLRQRNAMTMAEVKKVDSSLEDTPAHTVRDTYADALAAQQRLLTIQGQIDKLEAQEIALSDQVDTVSAMRDKLHDSDSAESAEIFNAREIIIKVIDAQEEERERLARQMHDGPAHSLTNFILQAEICQKLFDKRPDKAREELVNLKQSASDSFQKVRAYIFELRPMMLGDLGIAPTVQRYVESFSEKNDIEAEFETSGPKRRLEDYREVLIFRGIQAIMANARDHGSATRINVRLDMSDNLVQVVVEDNGRGLGTGQLSMDSNNPEALGLGTLQDRVRLVGGNLSVESISTGTRISFEIPTGPELEEADDALYGDE